MTPRGGIQCIVTIALKSLVFRLDLDFLNADSNWLNDYSIEIGQVVFFSCVFDDTKSLLEIFWSLNLDVFVFCYIFGRN